jgi:hypothetical protein
MEEVEKNLNPRPYGRRILGSSDTLCVWVTWVETAKTTGDTRRSA